MIHTWQITHKQTKQLHFVSYSSLDEITRQLPDGYYSTFRTYGGGRRVIGLKAHLQRLYGPVKSPDAPEARLRQQLRILLLDYPHEARVRVIMTKAGHLYVMIEPLRPLPREIYQQGVHVETVQMARITPRLKSTAFISRSQQERKHIAQNGIFEALMVKNGKITEGMTSNFFYVAQIGNLPFLSTAQRDVLLGVTRRTVIRVARGSGLDVRYLPLKLDHINSAHEAFITSSSRGIVPVVQIDENIVGEGRVGAITKQLLAAYEAYVLEKAEQI